MSGWMHLTLQARLHDPPAELISWLTDCADGDRREPPFASEAPLSEMLPLLGEVLPHVGPVEIGRWVTWSGTMAYTGENQGAVYALCFLLGQHCEDGVIAVYWLSFDEYPRTILVQGGRLYECAFGDEPTQLGPVDSGSAVPWQGKTWTVAQVRQPPAPGNQ